MRFKSYIELESSTLRDYVEKTCSILQLHVFLSLLVSLFPLGILEFVSEDGKNSVSPTVLSSFVWTIFCFILDYKYLQFLPMLLILYPVFSCKTLRTSTKTFVSIDKI
jgi:hypothetical protein